MKLVRTIALSLCVAGASAFGFACGGTVEHSPQTSAGAATKAPIAVRSHGMVKLVGDALGEVPLRPEQRAEIEKLASEAEARHAPMADGRKDLMLAFADQVEKGSIDRAALQPKIDKVTADFEKVRAADRGAVVKLHDLLDANQRNALVDAVEAQMKAKHGEHMRGGFGKLKQLADELQLTDAQKAQLGDAMREAHKDGKDAWKRHSRDEHGPAHARGKGGHGNERVLEAFREDKLSLDTVAPAHDTKTTARFATDRAAAFAEKILPVLTPEQRKIAADKLRVMAANGEGDLLVH